MCQADRRGPWPFDIDLRLESFVYKLFEYSEFAAVSGEIIAIQDAEFWNLLFDFKEFSGLFVILVIQIEI